MWRVSYRGISNCRTMATAGPGNLLGRELSPYLRQHKDNPVNWYPWGQEAIKKAQEEKKMIFLSIGYSTCHWCHVMERESFESEAVAKVMNEHFINIKVDREERPDVDKVYMTFVQATTGSGGWPLSIWMTPSLHPVFGGTYFPPTGNYGRPGFTQVLTALSNQWSTESEELSEQGRMVLGILDKKLGSGALTPTPSLPPASLLAKLYAQLQSAYDEEYGGYSKAPKFPQPSNLLTMFRLHSWSGQTQDRKKRGLQMNLHTLDMMDKGGIHDHISQGFARYSTDRQWHVPHFEKMLYDQAQLMMAYTAAALLSPSPRHREVVEDIASYVARDLTHPLGGFYSAEDADSLASSQAQHKTEGAFCVWSWEEVQSLLGQEEVEGHTLASLVAHEYNMEEGGNVRPAQDPHGELTGLNVLTRLPCREPLFAEADYSASLARAKEILLTARLARPRPGLDTKILTSWNSLMVSALARAGTSLGEQKYTDMAVRAATFLEEHLYSPSSGRLLRSVYGGEGGQLEQLPGPIQGFVDDYVYTVQACLDLYTATLSESWLQLALRLQEEQDRLFLDIEAGGYYSSQEGDSEIVLRPKDDQDGAEPSSNSVATMNLLRLARILGKPQYQAEAEKIFKLFGERLEKLPLALPAMVEAYLYNHEALPCLVIVGPKDNSHPLLAWVRVQHLPSLTVVHLGEEGSLVREGHPVLESLGLEQGGYLLKEGQVGELISSVEELKVQLSQQ